MSAVTEKTRFAFNVGALLTAAAMLFSAGATWAKVNNHASSNSIHYNYPQHEAMIDKRVDLLLAPIRVELSQMNEKLDRLLEKM